MRTRQKRVYDSLIETARGRDLVSYEEIAGMINLDMRYKTDRDEISDILGDINKEEVSNGQPMLSAVVVYKATINSDPRPGPGFYSCALELGVMQSDDNKREFYRDQRNNVYDWWAGVTT